MSTAPAWIDITARDASRSREFYRALFGWQIRVDPTLDYGIVAPEPGQLPGGIGQANGQNPHPPGILTYLSVPDLEQSVRRAEQLGGAGLLPAWELPGLGRMAVVADPEGNRLGLWQS